MAEIIPMLALSPTMEKGVIVRWRKQEGERIASGDILCDVETDKTTMEYESTTEGILLKIIVPAGQEAPVGQPIAIAGEEGEDISALVQGATVPAIAAAPVPSIPAAEASLAGSALPVTAGPPLSVPSTEIPSTGHVRVSPLARKLAGEQGIDLRRIAGSGPGGRIVKRDLDRDAASSPASPAGPSPESAAAGRVMPAGAPPAAARETVPTAAPSPADTVMPVSQKRRIIAQRLSESKFTAPHYYLRLTVRMDGLLQARQAWNAGAAEKLSLNAFLIKFAAEALKRHPPVNSSWRGDSILRYGRQDIALAVAQEDGLITPVVRDCGGKGIVSIQRDLSALIEKARQGTLVTEEYTGATFTISNLGSYGIEEFTAIINPPGSAILAVGEIRREPVVMANDELQIQSRLRLTLSCDHRLIDGAVGAAFLQDLKEMMEEPVRALF